VFTQFLGMIDLFERHLSSRGISFVSLTGASRDRGEIVRSFNEEEDVRVFLGSLKAGGTGIDLTSASVVIHYDRWWNAAREDQATDRVYRLGQNKAVSVLKLTTEGTLEEKISAIIESKRRLMEDVVQVDDPRERKVFTREELIHLLEPV
jgi:SNF2 family DNA or RNA helicase